MTTTAVDLYPHDEAVLEALSGLHVLVGYAEAPAGALDSLLDTAEPLTEYLVLYPIGGTRSGSAIDPNEDAHLTYQVTVVALLPETARALVSRIESALRTVDIPGRVIVKFAPADSGGVRPDPIKPEAFIATPRFSFWTTPAH
jgi:hypothetical protein